MDISLKKLILIFVPPVLLLAVLVAQPFFPAVYMFQDPIIAAQSSYIRSGKCCGVYFGFVSNLGIVLWSIPAVSCACAALVLQKSGVRQRDVSFMMAAAALTALLGLDDLFLLHEGIFPKLGIPQTLVLVTYAALALGYMLYFRSEITARDLVIFGLAIAFLAASLAIDVLSPDYSARELMAEDSAKFVGIAGWAGFHTLRAIHYMGDAVEVATEKDDEVEKSLTMP